VGKTSGMNTEVEGFLSKKKDEKPGKSQNPAFRISREGNYSFRSDAGGRMSVEVKLVCRNWNKVKSSSKQRKIKQ